MRHSTIAFFAAVTHIAGSFAMLLLLRRGLPGFPADDRLAYIATHRVAWTGGWLVWQVAAISLVGLYAVLAMRFRGPLSITAMAVAAAGLSIDISSESRYIAVLPELRGAAFDALDRELEVLIGYGGNGLYTVALLLLVAEGWRLLPRAVLALTVPIAVSGFTLAVAALQHDARMEMVSSAVLFPLFTLWIVLVGLWLRRSE